MQYIKVVSSWTKSRTSLIRNCKLWMAWSAIQSKRTPTGTIIFLAISHNKSRYKAENLPHSLNYFCFLIVARLVSHPEIQTTMALTKLKGWIFCYPQSVFRLKGSISLHFRMSLTFQTSFSVVIIVQSSLFNVRETNNIKGPPWDRAFSHPKTSLLQALELCAVPDDCARNKL